MSSFLPCFIFLPFIFLHSNIESFLFPLFRLKCRPAFMVYRSSQLPLLFSLISSLPIPFPPSLPSATWYGCQVIDGCVRQSHESCFYSEGMPYKTTAIFGYWTNKLWASRKSISYIDKHMNAHTCTHNEMQMETRSCTHECKQTQRETLVVDTTCRNTH